MYIMVPLKIDGLDVLINKIDSSTFQRTQKLLKPAEINVAIPKFRFTNAIHLKDVLQEVCQCRSK